MVSLFMGWKPGFGPVVKVLRYDQDDPLTLANDAYDRYFFNSETQDLSYIFDKFHFSNGFNPSIYPATAPNTSNYVLDGATLPAARRALSSRWASSTSYYFKYYEMFNRFPDMAGMVPIFEAKLIDPNDRVKLFDFNGADGNKQLFSIGTLYNAMSVYADNPVNNQSATIVQYDRIAADLNFTGWCGQISNYTGPTYTYMIIGGNVPVMRALTCQWDLPANNAPLPFPDSPPTPGQEVVRLSGSEFKVARRGQTVDSLNPRGFLINSNKAPNMCVMMGETPIIPAGGSYYFWKTTPIDLHPLMFLDGIMRFDGMAYSIPPVDTTVSRSGREARFYYKIDQNGIMFTNEGNYAIGCKFMVYATSIEQLTNGGSLVMRTLPDGNIQIKRPGSSDIAPNSNDILLDTRFPSVRIIKEGWLPLSQFSTANSLNPLFGTHAAVVPFQSSGLFIFPKVVGNWPKMMAQGYYRSLRRPDVVSWFTSNYCMTTVVRENDMVIHLSPGRPTDMRADSGEEYSMPDPTGARYYVLGAARLY
ncbi:hypothetical protein [Ochrobactrum quorumnocens]|uniref:hypothetical protein n=1 Tax=Ochrobactrum quorumnocens TaxID=271865 RepID=UPI003BA310F8